MHNDEALARRLLVESRTIAVLGAFTPGARPAYYVPEYLEVQGYRILPVNPRFAGQTLFGETCVATLAELKQPVDFVDVFRRADMLASHVDDILAMTPRVPAVWFQQGIRNDEVAETLRASGIEVVQDRCTLADHRWMGIGKVS